MNKQQLQKEIEALQKQLEEKQKALAAMPEKWEPKGGDYWVNSWGQICFAEGISSKENRDFGAEHATREQAEKAAKAMRAHNRLLAYVSEVVPEYNPNWKDGLEEKAYVAKSNADFGEWTVFVHGIYKAAGVVYMPVNAARELCRKLNSGEVEL